MIRRFALLALAVIPMGSPASAQTPDWDRRISDIHIVHPPGTPPGFWALDVDLGLMTTSNTPQPPNLDFDLIVRVNGVVLGGDSFGVATSSSVGCTGICTQDCWSVVVTNLVTTIAMIGNGICGGPTTWTCGCWWTNPARLSFPLVAAPGDLIQVEIAARPGSLPELYTPDDTFSKFMWQDAPGTDFCFGNSVVVTCPCGNSGAAGNGCASSINPAGANLIATGSGSVSSDSVVLTGSGMPNGSALYFQGTAQVAGGFGAPFGDGLRCAGGSVLRLGTKTNAGGTSQYPELGDLSVSVKGAVPPAGGTRIYQTWYRNAAAFCTVSTFNLTNGVEITWQP